MTGRAGPRRSPTAARPTAPVESAPPADSVGELPPFAAAASPTLDALARAAAGCRGCPLHASATQVVVGDGPATARLVLVGEQPGDQEDKRGEPFVGPAGRVLDDALDALGVPRRSVYLTNAVKHFKWEPRGKARIHQRPNASEIEACHPWLARELELVAPDVVVALGATAARSVIGRPTKIGEARGRLLPVDGVGPVVVTIHPSAVLRAHDAADRHAMFAGLVDDLRVAATAADSV